MDLTEDERGRLLAGVVELAITYTRMTRSENGAKLLLRSSGAMRKRCSSGGVAGNAGMSRLWEIRPGSAVAGVVSVLSTSDRRLFLMHADGTFRVAAKWERDEVLLQMLSWRNSTATG